MKLTTALALARVAVKANTPALTGEAFDTAVATLAEKFMADPAAKMDVGEPPNELARLLAESGFAVGAGGAPSFPQAILSAIMGLPAMKSVVDRITALEAAVNGVAASKSADGAEVAAQPGLRAMAEKALELGLKTTQALGVPVKPAADADPEAARKSAEEARKKADPDADVFEGSAWDLS